MFDRNSKLTIVSMTVIAAAAAPLLHEAVGHGLTAWTRGDIPTELTSNHLSSLRADRVVAIGGTIVNLIVGAIALAASRKAITPNTRYFLWLLGALNLLPAAGYFMYSGIFGFGDWFEVIRGLPHQLLLRTTMTVFGAALYVAVVRLLAILVRPFVPHRSTYNTVGRLPYCAACLFTCIAGLLDPLGFRLLLLSTLPAAFGGSSGLLWADSLMPRAGSAPALVVRRQPAWWFAAAVIGASFILVLGPGIKFAH